MEPSELSHVAMLRVLITTMENDLGLDKLSGDERNLIYTMSALSSDGHENLRTEDMKKHPLCQNLSHPTFYRALRTLLDKGYVSRAGSRKTGTYSLHISKLGPMGNETQSRA
ncbi:hypothetical protein [Roseovarius indicus]|uniref:MarR family transcriptional regulator n=2 Tax=Roseovarius indicus TaxID=540747 RepID=A0A5P3AA33_9RHOB|nr:hypothetical protein [Roseovarius indicus]QEW25258.1 hypothetical protein RIdsm_01044 [Roseovarius indicus]SFE19520.1 hypothetical protein SAMN04488031_106146 [Roseovarius indicus]